MNDTLGVFAFGVAVGAVVCSASVLFHAWREGRRRR